MTQDSVHLDGRIAGASTGVYEFNSVVKGRHIHKTAWTPLVDETLQVHGVGRYQQMNAL